MRRGRILLTSLVLAASFHAVSPSTAPAQPPELEHLPQFSLPPAPGRLPAGVEPYRARLGAPARNAAERAFDLLVDRALEFLLAADPVRAGALGVHAYDALLPAADSASVAADADSLAGLRKSLRAIDVAALDDARRADGAHLVLALQGVGPLDPQRDPAWYADVALRGIGGLFHAQAPLRGWNVVARLVQLPGLLKSGRANVTIAARADVLDAIAQSKALLDLLSNNLPVAMAGETDPGLREEFDHHLASAAGAAADYHDWLASELLPRAGGEALAEPDDRRDAAVAALLARR